jgi:hypothetical protein
MPNFLGQFPDLRKALCWRTWHIATIISSGVRFVYPCVRTIN